ncbi:MAG: hypothetical protein ACRER3_21700 [Pseudomonas fluorescens]
MSTFAVFGMSENWAREEAKEHTPTFKNENGKRIDLTVSQWEAEVELQIAKIMAGKKCVRLSLMFDAPPVRAAVHGNGSQEHRVSRPENQDQGRPS